jgi:serine protease Do
MKRIKYWAGILILLIIIFTVTGCDLPGIEFNIQTATPQTPTPTATPPPINPTYSVPTVAASSPPITSSISLPDLASVIAKVRPSVVAINTKVPTLSIFGGSFTQEGAGSGWIIDSSGLIVTNNHVVEGANSISVTLEDGRDFLAETVRTDRVSDLAIVKINAQSLPPAIKVGDSSKLRVGDWVIAIGNSLGQGISATKGIVSALGVSVAADSGETLYDLIQTDAAINPGNSGGPLVNLAGEVIGINSIKVAQVGVEGMGYAISTKVAVPIIDALVKTGYVTRPWMGVGLYAVDQTVVIRYRLAVNKGVLVTQVSNNSPAAKAGIKPGDVITAVESKDVATVDEFTKTIRSYNIGQTVRITYWRGNSQTNADVILAQAPLPGTP